MIFNDQIIILNLFLRKQR